MTSLHPTPRIYVASLSDYNAGRLHGRWIDADQSADDIQAEIGAMLAESREPIAEEWAIHDYDNFGGLHLSEYESIEHVADLGAAIAANGPAFAAYAEHVGADQADVGGFDEAYCGEWDSFTEYVEDYVDQTGMLDGVNELVSRYFDVDSFARDLLLDSFYTAPAPAHGVYVFRRF